MFKYPKPKGGEMMIKREVDTARVELKQLRSTPTVKIGGPRDVVELVKEMQDYDRERFKVIYLDTKNGVLGVENVAEGTLNAALIHPRETFKGAILANAASIVVVHNHPSGDPAPSREDENIIQKLTAASKLIGIEVMDAIIIGRDRYYSFEEDGKLPVFKRTGCEIVMENNRDKDDACSTAVRAAMSVIEEQCGEGEREIDIGGVRIKVTTPESVMQVMEGPLTQEQRITAIAQSAWGQGEATGLCTKLFGLSPGTDEYIQCIERVSRKLAEGMVGK